MKTEMQTGKLHWKIIDGVHYGQRDGDSGREGFSEFAQVFRGTDRSGNSYRLFIKNHQVGVYRSATEAKRKAEELA